MNGVLADADARLPAQCEWGYLQTQTQSYSLNVNGPLEVSCSNDTQETPSSCTGVNLTPLLLHLYHCVADCNGTVKYLLHLRYVAADGWFKSGKLCREKQRSITIPVADPGFHVGKC